MPDRSRWTKAAFLAAMLMGAATAPAQPLVRLAPAPPTAPDIVVTASPDPNVRAIERQAIAITRVGDLFHDPLPRFAEPVCPGIVGLPADVAGLMIDRIRYDAERIGAVLDRRAGCQANILVLFVRDGAAQLRTLLKSNGFLLANLDTAEANAIVSETGPVRAWNTTRLRTRYGEPDSGQLQRGPLRISGALTLGPVRAEIVPMSDSHIFLASRLDIVQSVIVVNVAAIDGLSIDQIADYAAMRALANTRPAPGAPATATILSLFDPAGSPPPEMTRFDLAYLRSLYDAGSNLPAIVKIGGIPHELRKPQEAAGNGSGRPQ